MRSLPYQGYAPGECAYFKPELAAELVEAGIGDYADGDRPSVGRERDEITVEVEEVVEPVAEEPVIDELDYDNEEIDEAEDGGKD